MDFRYGGDWTVRSGSRPRTQSAMTPVADLTTASIAPLNLRLVVTINDVDIGPAGSTYFRYLGAGNARASRTGPGLNFPYPLPYFLPDTSYY